MNWYILLKYIHVISAILMVGTSVANGMIRLYINKSQSSVRIAVGSELIMHLNRIIMIPTLLALPVTGVLILYVVDFSLSSKWVLASLVLATSIIIAFSLGWKVESKMEKISLNDMLSNNKEISSSYWKQDKSGTLIGGLAGLLILGTIYIMVSRSIPFLE